MTKHSVIYDEKSIKHLSGLAGIRKRPEMYIGPTDSHGIWTLIREAADNTVDEFIAERNKLCHIIIEEDAFWVIDSGEGIPTGPISVEDPITHKKHKISALKAIVGLTHSGGKFEGKAYKKGSRGTHGVGLKATTALSESFQVWTCRKGKWFSIQYATGKLIKDVFVTKPPKLPYGLKKPKQGTIIKFYPDRVIFKKAKLVSSHIWEWANLTSVLNKGFLVKLTNIKGKTKEWYSKKGVEAYIKTLVEKLEVSTLGKIFTHSDSQVDIAVAFADYDGISFSAYTNGLSNVDGGVHVDSFYASLAKAIAPFKGKRAKFNPSDLRDGVVGLINVKIEAPKFAGQTKEKLVDPRAAEYCKEILEKQLKAFFSKNKSLVRKLLDRANKLKQLKDEFTKNKKVLKVLKQAKRAKNLLPGKLISSPNCKVGERELYVVEGDSAKGTTEFARDDKFQEVLPLKGKIMNVFKDAKGKALESAELLNILMSIGFDPSHKNPMDNLRIGKLFLLPDADVDGDHIGALCKAVIVKYIPEMFQRGMVYMVKTPEYLGENKHERFFGASVEDLKKAAGKKFKDLNVTHLKGLAEMSATALREVAFDPKTRRVIQIEKPSTKDIKRFKAVMAIDVQVRKTILGI